MRILRSSHRSLCLCLSRREDWVPSLQREKRGVRDLGEGYPFDEHDVELMVKGVGTKTLTALRALEVVLRESGERGLVSRVDKGLNVSDFLGRSESLRFGRGLCEGRGGRRRGARGSTP